MKQLFSERHALRDIKIKTDIIDREKYQMLIQYCDSYYNNLAADFPDKYSYNNSIYGVNNRNLIRELKYRIPRFHADNYWPGTPKEIGTVSKRSVCSIGLYRVYGITYKNDRFRQRRWAF